MQMDPYGGMSGMGMGSYFNPMQMMMTPPDMQMAMRRQMYAQSLMAQGSQTEPLRSPWQAAARALQGALGGYFETTSEQQMRDAMAQEQQQAMQFMGGGGGMGPQPQPTQAPQQAPPPNQQPAFTAHPNPNNMGNIKAPGGAGYMNYNGPADGIQAIAANLIGYQKDFPNQQVTLNQAIPRWQGYALGTTPPPGIITPENYVAYVAKQAGIDPNAPIPMNDPDVMSKITKAIATIEKGPQVANAIPDSIYHAATAGGIYAGAPPVTGPAGSNSNSTLDIGQNQGPALGFQTAQALLQRAMVAEMSPNPYIRAQAPMLRAQAQSYMQMGSWGNPVPVGNGQYAIRNQISGESKIIGSQTTLTKDAAGNLVNNSGQVVAASGGWHQIGVNQNNQPIYAGPDGKPMVLGELPRPELDFANTIAQVNSMLKAGQMPSDEQLSKYQTAYNQLYPTEQHWDDKAGQVVTLQPRVPPSGTLTPEDVAARVAQIGKGRAAGAPAAPAATPPPAPGNVPPPAPQAAPGTPPVPGAPTAPPTVQPPAVPTPGAATTAGGVTVRPMPGALTTPQVETVAKGTEGTMEGDQKIADEAAQAANEGRQLFATTQTIRDLLPKVQTGYTADLKLRAQDALRSLGATDPQLNESLVSGQLLQKNLLNLVAQRVREMGAREPGSVISMFAHNYPSLMSRPETIDAMTRIMDMDQQWEQERAAAMNDWIGNERQRIAQPGVNVGSYRSVNSSAFNQQWDATHDPRTYLGAALASSGMSYPTWSGGLTQPMQKQAINLAWQRYPDTVIWDKDNNKRLGPALRPRQPAPNQVAGQGQ